MNKIKQFFLSLLNANDPNSSKRFAGLMVLFTTISLAIVATINNHGNCPEYMFDGLLLFAAGAFAINGMESVFKTKSTTQIVDEATEPVDEKTNPDSSS